MTPIPGSKRWIIDADLEASAGFETSVDHFDTTLSLPLYPALTDEEHAACVRAAVEMLARPGSRGR